MPHAPVKPLRFYDKVRYIFQRIVPYKLTVCIFRCRLAPSSGVYAEADFGGSAARCKCEGNRVAGRQCIKFGLRQCISVFVGDDVNTLRGSRRRSWSWVWRVSATAACIYVTTCRRHTYWCTFTVSNTSADVVAHRRCTIIRIIIVVAFSNRTVVVNPSHFANRYTNTPLSADASIHAVIKYTS